MKNSILGSVVPLAMFINIQPKVRTLKPEFQNITASDSSGTCWPSTIMCTAANMELLLVMICLVTDNNFSITTFGLIFSSRTTYKYWDDKAVLRIYPQLLVTDIFRQLSKRTRGTWSLLPHPFPLGLPHQLGWRVCEPSVSFFCLPFNSETSNTTVMPRSRGLDCAFPDMITPVALKCCVQALLRRL